MESGSSDGPRVRVTAGARLHFGFVNLSLARERLYGAVGVALDRPRVAVSAAPADAVTPEPESSLVGAYAARACDLLGVPGASLTVHERLPRHVGLGSGTATALATLTAVARAHGLEPRIRERAPDPGRGGRSGVGVAAFRRGGLVADAGHPTGRFTTARPDDGAWEVPAVVARHELPDEWRFLLVVPDADQGRNGEREDDAMRSVVESANPAIADELAGVLTRRLLPAAAEGDLDAFGAAVREFGRLNGAWYADQQGGVYRPPAGRVVEGLSDAPVAGVGQSSWGPAVYGVTDADRAEAAREAAREALAEAGVDGEVAVVAPRNHGAEDERLPGADGGDGRRDGDTTTAGFDGETGTQV
jgi:beta-ribofuranosylaminobenzene 5'-phosphate synthase